MNENKRSNPKPNVSNVILVASTDALISRPDLLEANSSLRDMCGTLVIPTTHIATFRDLRSEEQYRGKACVGLLQNIADLGSMATKNGKSSEEGVELDGVTIRFQKPEGNHSDPIQNTFDVYRQCIKNIKEDENVSVLTADNSVLAEAFIRSIPVTSIEVPDFRGRRKLALNPDLRSHWSCGNGLLTAAEFTDGHPGQSEPALNEYIIFTPDSIKNANEVTRKQRIGRVQYDEKHHKIITPIDYSLRALSYGGKSPFRAKNDGQAILADALFESPEKIAIVVSDAKFGTGKTFLALLCGLAQSCLARFFKVEQHYDRIVIVTADPVGKDIGYLPGGKTAKTLPNNLQTVDNIYEILKIIDRSGKNALREITIYLESTYGHTTVEEPVQANEESTEEIEETNHQPYHSNKGNRSRGNARERSKQANNRNNQKNKNSNKASGSKPEAQSGSGSRLQATYYEEVYAMLRDQAIPHRFHKALAIILTECIVYEPAIYMAGRSFSNSFIIYDESQNTEPSLMRLLMSRIGDGTKMAILGDSKQVTNRFLSSMNNGLVTAKVLMAGDELTAVIGMAEDEVVRSKAAQHIAERIETF